MFLIARMPTAEADRRQNFFSGLFLSFRTVEFGQTDRPNHFVPFFCRNWLWSKKRFLGTNDQVFIKRALFSLRFHARNWFSESRNLSKFPFHFSILFRIFIFSVWCAGEWRVWVSFGFFSALSAPSHYGGGVRKRKRSVTSEPWYPFLSLSLRTKNQHTESIDNIRFVRGNICVTHFFRPSRAGIHLGETRTVSKFEANLFCLWKCLVSSSREGKEKIALQISCPKETKMMMEWGGHSKQPKQKKKKNNERFPTLIQFALYSFCRSPRDSRDLRLPGGRDNTRDTSEDSINT